MNATPRGAEMRGPRRGGLEAGFTLMETVIVLAILVTFLSLGLSSVTSLERSFDEDQLVSQITLEAQSSMDRLVEVTRLALSTDSDFTPLKPNTGVDSHCLQFRLFSSFDGFDPQYDAMKVYVYGPDEGANPCDGIVIGRGATLDQVSDTGAGADGRLGTVDDDTGATVADGVPAVELLVPSRFRPREGNMLEIDVVGRLVTLTMRLNTQNRGGDWVLDNDLVLSQRVALRQ